MSLENKLFICVAGMPGSGKGVVARAARDLGLPVVVMGDVVRREVERLGYKPTLENLNMVAVRLRREFGDDVIARRVLEEAERINSSIIVIDGVRSLAEIEAFRKKGGTIIVAVHASPRTRFHRLRGRGRPGDPRSWEEFVRRDRVELGFGLGNVIALADYMIVNEGAEELAYREARRILGEILYAEGKS